MDAYSQKLQYLLARYISNECTLVEKEALMLLIKQPGHEEEIKKCIEQEIDAGLPGCSENYPQLSSERATILFKKIIQEQNNKPVKIMRWWRTAAAAIFILIIGSFIYLLFTQPKNHELTASVKKTELHLANDVLPGTKGAILTLSNGQQIVLDSAGNGQLASQGSTIIVNKNGQIVYYVKGNTPGEILYNTMATNRGRQYQLLLPDGTRVWLNAESSIRYPVAFTGSTRSVTISGEAYFEVAKNPEIPFIVKVNDIEVKVLGTHFNINAYDDEAVIKTTLLEGSVHVSLAGNITVLAPGQQVKMYKNGSTELIQHADTEEAVAWKNGLFQFNKADIQSVMRQIGRWYDLEIAYQGAVPKDRFGGKLPMDANVSQVLGALEQTEVHFKIEGKKIIVMP